MRSYEQVMQNMRELLGLSPDPSGYTLKITNSETCPLSDLWEEPRMGNSLGWDAQFLLWSAYLLLEERNGSRLRWFAQSYLRRIPMLPMTKSDQGKYEEALGILRYVASREEVGWIDTFDPRPDPKYIEMEQRGIGVVKWVCGFIEEHVAASKL
jgi:hypothetical protein